jgi:hypothetical protein
MSEATENVLNTHIEAGDDLIIHWVERVNGKVDPDGVATPSVEHVTAVEDQQPGRRDIHVRNTHGEQTVLLLDDGIHVERELR